MDLKKQPAGRGDSCGRRLGRVGKSSCGCCCPGCSSSSSVIRGAAYRAPGVCLCVLVVVV